MRSTNRHSFIRSLKRKGLKEEIVIKIGLYDLVTSTTLESNKSLGQLERVGHLPLGIGDHGPGQRRDFFGAQPRLHRQEKQDAISARISCLLQVPQNGPLLAGTDDLRLFALHGPLPLRGLTLIR